jgi:hypothetical protein
MSEILTFAGEHPILSVVLWWIPFQTALLAFSRFLRSRNIKANGWPTAPIDADGDVVWPTDNNQ